MLVEVGALPSEEAPRSKTPLVVGAALLVLLLVAGGAGAWWWSTRTSAALANVPGPAPSVPSVPSMPAPSVVPSPAPTPPPSEPAAPVPGAMVTFRSEPSGATVQIGDREVPGTTPTALGDFPAGEYEVTMTLGGHAPWTETVVVRAGVPLEVEARLRRPVAARSSGPREVREPVEPPPPTPATTGRLSINTRPWSKVYVGERLLGTTPIGNADVPAGSVRLRIVDRDGTEHTRSVRVTSGGEERVFYDLSGIE
jgi:serine/threonine-protein kinase